MNALNHFLYYPLDVLPFVFIALVIAFTVHEFSHAAIAYLFGDPTAKREGRVTLDPRKHLDVLGTILIFIAGFGWAKPVPVNRSFFKHRRLMGVLVSAAGPISNLVLAFLSLTVVGILHSTGYDLHNGGVHMAVETFLSIMLNLNMILFLFNLIPIPPLDGYRIVEDLAPLSFRAWMYKYMHWGQFVFLLLIFIPPLYNHTLVPLFRLSLPIESWMGSILSPLFQHGG